MKMLRWFVISVLFMIVWIPATAFANTGIPTIFITLPAMLVSLVVVIGVEALFLGPRLNVSIMDAIKLSASANIISTVIGLPLASFTEGITAGVLNAVFKTTREQGILNDFTAAIAVGAGIVDWGFSPVTYWWTVPLAVCLILLSYFIASWLIERFVIYRMRKDISPATINRAILVANVASYGIISFIVLFLFIFSAITK